MFFSDCYSYLCPSLFPYPQTIPFQLADDILSLVVEIAEVVGHLSAHLEERVPTPQLRRENRIRTIYSSLAIENNSLSLEQVTAVIEGKRVLGAPREVQEVKNAIDAYDLMLELNPYSEEDLLRAHKLMLAELVHENGRYRGGNVGVFRGDKCEHMAPPAANVPGLMRDLLAWAERTSVHALISSCVFHYEFEFIHPFSDGNGRMGRMWQTLLLMRWNPLFAWLPVESVVKEHQQAYYDAIAQSDALGESTPFVRFMLRTLLTALLEMKESLPSTLKSQ